MKVGFSRVATVPGVRQGMAAIVVVTALGSIAACSSADKPPTTGSSTTTPTATATSGTPAPVVPAPSAPPPATSLPAGAAGAKVIRGTATPTPTISAASAAALIGKVAYPDGLSVQLVKATPGVESGQGPGVVAGRGYLRLDLAMVNGSKTDIDISQVVVSGRVGTGAPAPPVYPVAESPSDFSGVLAPGKEARAVYVVAISPKPGEAVTITVDFDGAHTSAVFTGPPA